VSGSTTYSKDRAKAQRAWELFHAKSNPTKDFQLSGKASQWPTSWGYAGRAETIYYASDKWKEEGNYLKYYHDTGAGMWLPQGAQSWLTDSKRCPVKRYPEAAAVLGYFLGCDFRRDHDNRFIEAEGDPKELLCSFPNRKLLAVVHPRQGVVALFAGRRLDVKAEGIVG